MIAELSTAMLVCAIPMPLKEGQEAKDRDIAKIRTALPDAMVESLRGPAPPSTQRFAGESGDRYEWIIVNPPGPNGSSKMLRLTPQADAYNPFKAKLGDAQKSADGIWQFTLVAEGGCRVQTDSDQTRKPVQ